MPSGSGGGGGGFPPTGWLVDAQGELQVTPTAPGAVNSIILGRAPAGYTGQLMELFEPSGFSAFLMNAKGDLYLSSNEPTNDAFFLQPLTALDAGKRVAFFGPSSGTNKVMVSRNGYTVIDARAEPADAELNANELAFWFDATNGVGNTKLMVKAKSADGTVKTASIVLA